MAKVFISYKRNVDPDATVATMVFRALSQNHSVFIDTTIQIGEKWAERIQNEIKQADYLIVFLSEYSVHSEMVIAEIETAHHGGRESGKPKILPVRLDYKEPFVYPLSAYLNPLQWAIWGEHSDTSKLIVELQKAISGGDLPVSEEQRGEFRKPISENIPTAFADIPLNSPEGTIPHESRFYIERDEDRDALLTLDQFSNITLVIKGPRQMGKSSLLIRLMDKAKKKGWRTAFIDFQLIERSSIENADVFYRRFCSLMSSGLGLEDRSADLWNSSIGHAMSATNYVTDYLLKKTQQTPIFLAMDEVERMFASPFRSDFFGMLRSWHNHRAFGNDWAKLNMALVTSTEPYHFISDLNQSPFNVGNVVELADFTQDQVSELNHLYRNPLIDTQVVKLNDLLGGHPYLTNKALFLIAKRRLTFTELQKNAYEDNGPFGDHLRNILFRISDQKMKEGLVQVIKYQRCSDERVFFLLRGVGLINRLGGDVMPRNKLYADYFGRWLNG